MYARATCCLTHLIAVREEVPVSIAPDKLAKLPLSLHGRHRAVIQPIAVLAGTSEVLVGVGDAISVEIHLSHYFTAAVAAAVSLELREFEFQKLPELSS